MKESSQYKKISRGQPVSLGDIRTVQPSDVIAVDAGIAKGKFYGKGFFDYDNDGNIIKDVLIFNSALVEPQAKPPLTYSDSEKSIAIWMRGANAPATREYAMRGVKEESVELDEARTDDEIAHEAGDLIVRLHQLIIISGFQVEPIIQETLNKLYTKYPPHLIGGSSLPFTEAMKERKALWGK